MGNHQNPVYNSKMTTYVMSCWILAAFGGLMFGYDIGISGGVSAMDDFLVKFFPRVHERKLHAHENNYCKYDDPMLQLFTSSLYLAALVASFLASKACTAFGRKPTIIMASGLFMAGAAFSAAAHKKWMLIVGRIFFGIGIGFGNEAVPLFLSEVAPIQHRGAVNVLFQLFTTIGILIANLVNYGTANLHPYGWRVSLALAGLPAIVLFFGSAFVITDTPTSLVERGKEKQGKEVLKRIRAVENIDEEFDLIILACQKAKLVTGSPFKQLMKRESRPPLVIAIFMQIFQQFTGINAIMFYAPILFQTVGFKSNASLLSAIVVGVVNVLSTLVAVYLVDKFGRRILLLEACCQMLISQVAIGCILAIHLKATGTLENKLGVAVLFLVCAFIMSFAWSWGPLGWLIPSETFPIETRTVGFAFAVSSNMFFTFLIAQVFLSMLCFLRAYIFFFFSAWILAMGLFVVFLLPETKGVPIDDIKERVWKKHKYWKKFMDEDIGAENVKDQTSSEAQAAV